MTSRDFCFWLQGFLELRKEHDVPANKGGLTQAQVECIERHLALAFQHEIDPSMGSAKHQADLDATHNAGPPDGPFGPIMRC